MQSIWDFKVLFYSWWVIFNCFTAFLEILFLFRFRNKSLPNKVFIVCYVFVVGLFTVGGIFYAIPAQFRLFLSLIFLFGYSIVFLKQKWVELLAPFIVVFTLSTFMEGFSAISLFFIAKTMTNAFWGSVVQLLVSIVFVISYGGVLHFIVKRYHITTEIQISPYLYVLLLPCSVIAVAVRSGLRLDTEFALETIPFMADYNQFFYSFCWILGAVSIFWVIIEAFYKLTILSMNETEKIQLSEKIKAQSVYINEAKKRNEQYRCFQHDVNNHLLVLSGLLQNKQYEKAKQYVKELYDFADMLSLDISTGNTILDILLMEKIRYAKQNGITITHQIHVPAKSEIEDMDLCILFANSLDNAIQACEKADDCNKNISIIAKQRYEFFLIDIVNGACFQTNVIRYGTGLKNMDYTAKKYGGTLTIQQSQNSFRLSIFLCLKCTA